MITGLVVVIIIELWFKSYHHITCHSVLIMLSLKDESIDLPIMGKKDIFIKGNTYMIPYFLSVNLVYNIPQSPYLFKACKLLIEEYPKAVKKLHCNPSQELIYIWQLFAWLLDNVRRFC